MKEQIFKIGKILIIVVIVLAVLGAISNFVFRSLNNARYTSSPGEGSLGLGSSDSLLWGEGMESKSNQVARDYEDSSSSLPAAQAGELTQKKIIKNANLRIYVKDAEAVAESIQELATKLDGFVNESNIYKSSDGTKSGNITIRVPAKNFEPAVESIKELAKEVESENINSEDVTEQYIDYEAQLRNLRAEETQYLQIMQKAGTINDTLSVANRLSNVRGRIEQIEGKLKFLERQVDMSTIRITLTADSDVEVFGIRWRPLIVAKRSLKNMLSGLSKYVDAMIAFIFMLPVIIVWIVTIIIVLVIIFKLLRWLYHKFFHWHKEE